MPHNTKLQNNALNEHNANYPFTTEDIYIAKNIWVPYISVLKSKTTQRWPQ